MKKRTTKKRSKIKKSLSFEKGLKYPWGHAKQLWNILWILIPVLGVFALVSYFQKIIRSLAKGKFGGLPVFGKFWDNCGKGFMLFVKFIPLIVVVSLIGSIPAIGWLVMIVVELFLLPYLIINFLVKDRFSEMWRIEKAVNIISKNFKEYMITLLKQIGYWIIYGIASIILIGVPCLSFGYYVYLVDFYKKHRK